MNKDILKEYFERQDSLNTTPRDEFKERLINDLHSRISRLERRQRFCTMLLIILAVVGAALLIWYYVPTLDVEIPVIDTSPSYILLTVLLFVIIFIASYIIETTKLNQLRRQLQALHS